MTEFEGAMKKVVDAIHTAARKSGEILENTKIQYNISTEKEKIAKLERKIGARFYKIFKDGGAVPESIVSDLEAISVIEEKIRSLEKTIIDSKPYKFCSECGAKLELNDVYCAKCGTKQHDVGEKKDEGEESCGCDVASDDDCDEACDDACEETCDGEDKCCDAKEGGE